MLGEGGNHWIVGRGGVFADSRYWNLLVVMTYEGIYIHVCVRACVRACVDSRSEQEPEA